MRRKSCFATRKSGCFRSVTTYSTSPRAQAASAAPANIFRHFTLPNATGQGKVTQNIAYRLYRRYRLPRPGWQASENTKIPVASEFRMTCDIGVYVLLSIGMGYVPKENALDLLGGREPQARPPARPPKSIFKTSTCVM